MKFCSTNRPMILAHRGETTSARENSTLAVRAARALGCDGIEIDVRMTIDGHLVVAHDPDINEMTIAETHLEELRREGEVDLLEDLLTEAKGMLVNLEVKGPVGDASSLLQTLNAVTEGFTECDFLISSFWISILEQVPRLMEGVAVGVLTSAAFDPNGDLALDVATENQLDVILPSVSAVSIELIQRARSMGIEVIAWTVNDVDAFRELREGGICGVISDRSGDMLAAR